MRASLATILGADLAGADALVMAAAVADYRPNAASNVKIKKSAGSGPPTIAFAENPDLIAEIGARRTGARPVLVAFALETGDDATVLGYARKKLAAKKVDFVVANAAHESLWKTTNRVAIVGADDASPFVSAGKDTIADLIVDRVAAQILRSTLAALGSSQPLR